MIRKMIFFKFDYAMKSILKNQIYLKLIRNLSILKLFTFYIKKLK